MRIDIEQRLSDATTLFKSRRGSREHQLGFDVELAAQFELPLLREVRRTEHGEPLRFASVQKFTGDEGRFDRLPDPDVVRN